MQSIKISDWPIYFRNILRVGDLESNIGVVTLWTERDVVQKVLSKKDYAAIGNLYASAGINHMLRNIFANPNIRYLVIWGADMSQSGHALVKFIQKGIDENYRIVGARGELEKEIPKKAIEEFRQNIKIIDLRGKTIAELKKTIESLEKLPPFRKKPEIFPPAKPDVSYFPSEEVGFRVQAETVAQTWLKILNLISRYGRTEKTRYASNNELKEILNLTVVITKENPDKEYFPHYLPFSKEELLAYYPEMMTSRRIQTAAYNYGHRLRNQQGINQIKEIISLLKRRPFSKKGFAVLYRVDDWKKVDSSDTPCMTQLHARITQNKLFLTAYFRSQDMFHGWPRNAFALRKVQKEIAAGVGMKMGPLSIITMSAHMYADDWKTAGEILKENYLKELKYAPRYPHLVLDPRGNWLIDIEYEADFVPDSFYVAPSHTHAIVASPRPFRGQSFKRALGKGKIVAKLFPDERMKAPLATFEGRTAKEVFWQIVDWELMVNPGHIFSIGEELTKAEIALRLGLEFKMDAPLDFTKKVKLSARHHK